MNKMHKDEEVKELILAAARKVFQKWGLNKTTMEDIAHEAGKGKSTLYYYFKSKEDIFEIVVLGEMEAIVDKARKVISECTSAKEKLKKYIYTIVTEAKQTMNIYPVIRGEIRGNRDFIDKLTKKLTKKDELMIADILRSGMQSGEFTILVPADVEKTASVISGFTDSIVTYLVLENEDNDKLRIALKLITEGI
jgi:AcrR family transcriptional regulator